MDFDAWKETELDKDIWYLSDFLGFQANFKVEC